MDTGLVFGILFAIIVIALLFVFGFDQINNIFCVGNTAQINKAVKELEDAVENVFNLAQGSAVPFDFSLPKNAEICFVNYSNPEPGSWHPDPDMYAIVRNQINSSRANLWIFYGCGTHKHAYRVKYLRVPENFCAGFGDEIYLENKGRYVTAEPG